MAYREDSATDPAGEGRQSASAVLMVRPARFAANPETRASNAFQSESVIDPSRAQREFDGVVAALRGAGVEVLSLDDEPEPPKPDAVFPNNWFSTHDDGRVVLYPMHAPNRRLERRADLVPTLRRAGYRCAEVLDLSLHEADGVALEGTGSLVLDRSSKVAFACRSPRTDDAVLDRWATALGYRTVRFVATDSQGQPVYHTNVVMAVGTTWAAACLESIEEPAERRAVAEALAGRELLTLTRAQMHGFAGNLLELTTATGDRVIALSSAARAAIGDAGVALLERHGRALVCDIPTIEALGGGSLRCMLAEIFLPREQRA